VPHLLQVAPNDHLHGLRAHNPAFFFGKGNHSVRVGHMVRMPFFGKEYGFNRAIGLNEVQSVPLEVVLNG
jgi:hypothetical protein